MNDLDVVHSVLAGLSWSIVALKTPLVVVQRRRAAVSFYRFMVGLAVAFTLLIPTVYVTIDQRIGLNNVTWLVAYLAISGGLFFLMDTVQHITSRPLPAALWGSGVVVNGLLVLLFFGAVRHAPISLNRDLSQDHAQFAFILTAHLYGILVFSVLFQQWTQVIYSEAFMLKKLRATPFLLTLGLAVIWLSLKVCRVVLFTFSPTHPAVMDLPLLYPPLLAGIGLSIVLAFLPTASYTWLAQRLVLWNDALALLEIRWLVQRLHPHFQGYYPLIHPWITQLMEPSLYLHLQVIYVYDSRKRLEQQHNVPVTIRAALQQLPLQTDYPTAVRACRRVSRQLFLRALVNHLRTYATS